MNVPLLDLRQQYQSIKQEIEPVLLKIAESQMLILGEEVSKLEKTLAEYCGTKYAIGVSSGTDALLMALMALEVGPGDEVILPTYSFFATAGVVSRLFAKPVFIDSEPVTFNINPSLIEKKITPKTKAIIPVHLYGQSCEMTEILEIANKYNIPVIEDAAQAIGCQYKNGKPVGSMGTMGCYSFYPTKNLGAFGDGGLIVTNQETLAKKLFQMRN
ncbi:MAG TPA: DegT/DnrJ/EryC1/StrS family aminotransferase, partial [Candidatus Kapabacteria bacterium]|nr:DegT/DnrJ/EryC1/StrS family aminotransferase [Candidatus Kapabacteria bacterium]